VWVQLGPLLSPPGCSYQAHSHQVGSRFARVTAIGGRSSCTGCVPARPRS
jgi:hypothetical protein